MPEAAILVWRLRLERGGREPFQAAPGSLLQKAHLRRWDVRAKYASDPPSVGTPRLARRRAVGPF